NCYSTCSLLSFVKDGKLVKVEGDTKHGFSMGRLCSKSYASTQYVYNSDRLRYPLRQNPRGSGRFERIDWETALSIIAEKILELNARYGSNLAVGYNKFSGNLGLLHYATEGFFEGLGPHTRSSGDLCQAAGHDAQLYDFGRLKMPDPEYMAKSKGIVLWGSNSAVTAVQQWFFINRAREQGGKLVVIDPVFTPTAAQGDLYIQITPGTDGLLALGICKLLLEGDAVPRDFLKDKTVGFDQFKDYLAKEITLDKVSRLTGVSMEAISELAEIYKLQPVATWVGFGMQRHINGGQNARAINALAAVSGQIGLAGGGVYYIYNKDCFPINIKKIPKGLRPTGEGESRELDIANFPHQALQLKDPPLKALWVASRNPLSQDPQPKYWHELFQRLELIVTVDLFMTEMAIHSDIVLPAASYFEDEDLNFSYWHNWVTYNERAIPPYYEAKSDLQIARLLTAKLNQLSPGFSTFPAELTGSDWIEKEFNQELNDLLGIKHWQELLKGPKKLALEPVPWKNGVFATPSGKYEFYSALALKKGLPALPEYAAACNPTPSYPLQLLTTRELNKLHSQYGELPWLAERDELDLVYVNPEDAAERRLAEGDMVKIFNHLGLLLLKVSVKPGLPKGVVTLSRIQEGISFNELIDARSADMGSFNAGFDGNAFYSAYVQLTKYQGGEQND
ncbi:MAG: molybdopterin-dependent oxidoreductase, partial [Bacillota bacterium]